MPPGGRFDHGHASHHPHEAGEVVLVDRRHFEIDEAIRLRRGDSALRALDDRVKPFVDGVADPLRESHGSVLRLEDQPDRAVGERDAAAGHAGPELGHRVERALRHRIDEQRPLGDAEHMAIANLVAEHGHLRKPGLHQPAAIEARGVVVGGHLDIHVEPIPLPDARRQIGMHPDERRRLRSEEFVGLHHAAGLHVGHQLLTLKPRRRIAAAVRQAGNERGPLDALRVETPRCGVVSHELGVGFEGHESRHFRALAANRGAGAARRDHAGRGGDTQNGERRAHRRPCLGGCAGCGKRRGG